MILSESCSIFFIGTFDYLFFMFLNIYDINDYDRADLQYHRQVDFNCIKY